MGQYHHLSVPSKTACESQPSQDITDAESAVRSSNNPSNTALDISRVPTVVPGSFYFPSTEDDLVQRAAQLLQLVVPWLRLGRDNSQDNGKTGKDSDDLGHGDEEWS